MGKKKLNSDENLILLSVAKYLQELEYSESFEELLAEAQIERNALATASIPSLLVAHYDIVTNIDLDCWIARYLKTLGFTNSSRKLLVEVSLQVIMNAQCTEQEFKEFLGLLTVHLKKKKTKQDMSKRKKTNQTDDENEDDDSVQQHKKIKRSEPQIPIDENNDHQEAGDAFKDKRKKTNKTSSKKSVLTGGKNEDNDSLQQTVAFRRITELLQMVQTRLAPLAGSRAGIMRNSKLSSWNWTNVLYSWRTKRPDLECEPYRQKHGDCWCVALSRGQRYAVLLSGSDKPLLTPEEVRNGVSPSYQNEKRGLVHLHHVGPFLLDGYVDEVKFHARPPGDSEDFEFLIEKLLRKCPVVVSFDIFPSYKSHKGNGVFIPKDEELKLRDYENFGSHVVLVTGYGLQIVDGVITKFWEYQNSYGKKWGQMGYGLLARGMGLVANIVELKVTKKPKL